MAYQFNYVWTDSSQIYELYLGNLKGMSSLVVYEKFSELRYKYRDREF